jgi:RNA polymerase sigma-B factor
MKYDPVEAPVELLREYSETRDRSTRNQIIEQMMPFAERIARQYANKGENIDDLQQVALIGLLKSVERFDPEHGAEFLSFASVTINGELKRHFRDRTWKVRIPRRLQELHLEMRQVRADLASELNRVPTPKELAEAMNISEEQLLEAIEAEQAYHTESLDAPFDTANQTSRIDLIGEEDSGFAEFDRIEVVKELLGALDDRDRTIVEMRFFEEKTQSEIAQEIDISQMHVSRLLERVTAVLRNEYRRMNAG